VRDLVNMRMPRFIVELRVRFRLQDLEGSS